MNILLNIVFFAITGLLSNKMLFSSAFLRSSAKSILISSLKMSSSFISKSAPKVLVPIANGSEEIEAVTIIDTLVRGGAVVTVASVEDSLLVTCSRGVKLSAEKHIKDCVSVEWDAICVPGGMPGSERLRDSNHLKDLLITQNTKSKLIAAICAAPAVVLGTHGLLKGKASTCYPALKFRESLPGAIDDAVVVDGNIVTSQGPGTSLKFSLKVVELLVGKATADKVGSEMLFGL